MDKQQSIEPIQQISCETTQSITGTFITTSEKRGHIQHNQVQPTIKIPDLQGSPAMGGINPARYIPDRNLAGCNGIPAPQDLTRSNKEEINRPDFDLPDFAQARMQAYDLTTPGISYTPTQDYQSDPSWPDLGDYEHPYGLTTYQQQGHEFKPDASGEDAEETTRQDSLTILHHPLAYDPTLPQSNPQLQPDRHMQQRPGDLASDALEQMHQSPYYQQEETVPYNEVFMDQGGMNTSRRRHLDLLISGLDEIGS